MACADCDNCPFDTDTNGIHEIHISVPVQYENGFYDICNINGIKGLSVTFVDTNGNNNKHVMTAEVFKGSSSDAYLRMVDICHLLQSNNITIDRRKIESTVSTKTPSLGYYERHIRYNVDCNYRNKFFELISNNEIKISYNTKHKSYVPLLTLKSNKTECLDTFTKRFTKFEHMMLEAGFAPTKTMLERCWFDDNYKYDDIWSYV